MKNINQTLKNYIAIILATLFLVGTASAIQTPDATITPSTSTKNVIIGSSTGVDFVLTLTALKGNAVGEGTLIWDSGDSTIVARMDNTGSFVSSGSFDVTTVLNSPQDHTLTVKTADGVINGQSYPITINFCRPDSGECVGTGKVRATASATVIPTPELSTSVFTAVGLIGLLGMVKFSKKN